MHKPSMKLKIKFVALFGRQTECDKYLPSKMYAIYKRITTENHVCGGNLTILFITGKCVIVIGCTVTKTFKLSVLAYTKKKRKTSGSFCQ